jgi:hypothetical protein
MVREYKGREDLTMKATVISAFAAAGLAMTAPRAHGQTELVLQHLVEPGAPRSFEHPYTIVLANGYWAKAGSDVTLSIVPQSLLQVFDVVPDDPYDRSPVPAHLRYSGSQDVDLLNEGPVLVKIGKNVRLPNPSNYYAVSAIGIEEENNNPCKIYLWGRMVDPRFGTADRLVAEYASDTCKDRLLFGSFDYEDTGVSGPSDRFIRGLRVCMGGKDPVPPLGTGFDNNEIKGLRIREAVVSQDGAVKALHGVKEWKRAHCPDEPLAPESAGNAYQREGWANWIMCPDGQILTGVKVYGSREFVALGVHCMSVRLEPMTQVPVKDKTGY